MLVFKAIFHVRPSFSAHPSHSLATLFVDLFLRFPKSFLLLEQHRLQLFTLFFSSFPSTALLTLPKAQFAPFLCPLHPITTLFLSFCSTASFATKLVSFTKFIKSSIF